MSKNNMETNIINFIEIYYKINDKIPTKSILFKTIPKKIFYKYFINYNDALFKSNIKMNFKLYIQTKCSECNKEFHKLKYEIIRNPHDFCNNSCAAIYNNKKRRFQKNWIKICNNSI